MSEILLCVSQQQNETPYMFKVTRTQVFSIEEALFHVYHYWKQSEDDVLSAEFICWVNDTLSLSYLAAKMKEMAKIERFSQRLLQFLNITEYFNADEINAIKKELQSWEKRLDWEKLKEQADYLMRERQPDAAAAFYRRALAYEENAALLNNLAVSLMQTEEYAAAYFYLSRALSMDENNDDIFLHCAEAAIYDRRFDTAAAMLEKAERLYPGSRDVKFLLGELAFEQKQYNQSADFFKSSINKNNPELHFVFRLSDAYVKLRQYDRALETLEMIAEKDVETLMKQAELHAGSGNVPAAIKTVQRAIFMQNNDVNLWTKLANYFRLDYDLTNANAAIIKALSINPDNEHAKLENARIKKGMGRVKEYQSILHNLLDNFKQRYRERESDLKWPSV